MEDKIDKQHLSVNATQDTVAASRLNTMAPPPFSPTAGTLNPRVDSLQRDSVAVSAVPSISYEVPAGRLIARSVGKGGVNDTQDIEAVLGRLVALKVITPQEAMKNCPDDVARYVLRYQGMISNRPGDGLVEAGKATETSLIQGKTTKPTAVVAGAWQARQTGTPTSNQGDKAYWDTLKTVSADAAGAETILAWGDQKAAQAFADICKIKRWDLLWAIFQQQYWWDTDWMAREIIRHLSQQEIAQLPKALRAKIRSEVGSGWMTSDEQALLEKMNGTKAGHTGGTSPGQSAQSTAHGTPAEVDTEARALALEKAKEYVDKNPGKTYAFSSPPSPPGGKVDCSGLMRAAIMAGGYPDPFFDPITGKQNPGVAKEDGTGNWENGVALLVSHPNWVKKPLESVVSGDMVTFRTTRSDHKGEDGKYDHIGIVNEVTLGEDGNVVSFTFVHSSSSNGPAHGDYTIAEPPSWLTASGAYAWDNPVK